MRLGPRLVVGGTHSGVGKTTVATGLMAAFRARGRRVAPAKIGPDFIDPGYHALACGRPPRNLDPWLCGPELMPSLAVRAAQGAELLIVEGLMGLFDGAADGTPSSTADVARLLDAPVLLVVDCSAQAGSVAAQVHGFATFDPRLRVAGVVLNRLASAGHEQMVRSALDSMARPVPVVGALRHDERLAWRDRHLGLVPVAERPAEVAVALDVLAESVRAGCDLEAIEAIAQSAPGQDAPALPMPERVGRARVAIAGGRAFTFAYPDNAESLVAAGAEIVPFDPLVDERLPAGTDAIVVGGGFPEVMAEQLSANRPLLEDVRRGVAAGMAVWAECGGFLWLCRSLDGQPMAGVLPADGLMTDRLSLGYRTAACRVASPLGPAGTRLRGHEFHYSRIEPSGDALEVRGLHGGGRGGYATPTLLASYVHVHLAGQAHLAEAFVRSAGSRLPENAPPAR
ncbi:MAG: cobyrinate a,c-diamide synthase [Chloroflexi bacterium]|nr:cobyrinate a,c-diamide synthase [Chloroflexota bacterium]